MSSELTITIWIESSLTDEDAAYIASDLALDVARRNNQAAVAVAAASAKPVTRDEIIATPAAWDAECEAAAQAAAEAEAAADAAKAELAGAIQRAAAAEKAAEAAIDAAPVEADEPKAKRFGRK